MHASLIYAQLSTTINAAYTNADRVDEEAVHALLPGILAGALDQATIAFLQTAPRLVLDTTAALTNVLDTHRYHPHCTECGTRKLCRTVYRIGEIFTPVHLLDPGHPHDLEDGVGEDVPRPAPAAPARPLHLRRIT